MLCDDDRTTPPPPLTDIEDGYNSDDDGTEDSDLEGSDEAVSTYDTAIETVVPSVDEDLLRGTYPFMHGSKPLLNLIQRDRYFPGVGCRR